MGVILQRGIVVISDDENGHFQRTPASVLSLATRSAAVSTFTPGDPLGGFGHLQHFQMPRRHAAEIVDGLDIDRLLLCLHDVGEGGVARLVEPQVGGHHGRQIKLQGLQPAVHFPGYAHDLAVNLDLRGEGRLGPSEQRRQHLAHRVVVSVDGLLAHEDQARAFGLGQRLEQLGHLQRLGIDVRLDQDAAVGAHGQGGANGFLGLDRADGDGDDLFDDALFLQPNRLFHRDLAEGIHRHLDVGQVDAGLVGFHPRLHVVIDHPFHRDQNLH